MHWRNSARSVAPAALMVVAGAVALWPALAQRSPESILPPGFSQPEPANTTAPRGDASPGRPMTDTPSPPGGQAPGLTDQLDPGLEGLVEDVSNNQTAAVAPVVDLPTQARRSLDHVGLLASADGAFGDQAFGSTDGRYLSTLMQQIKAPVASRWASILLRRVLVSPAMPSSVDGADWIAERAWLLLRMGEADTARALVSRVDSENFSARLSEVAMQAALATGDPAAVCAIAGSAASQNNEPSWPLAQAMCSGLAGESGTASALVDQVRDTGSASGIDVLLAEKVVGASTNTRRSVSIQWDGVDRLTAWRFGLASATGVVVPPALYATATPQVLAWQARSPLLDPASRVEAAERATTLGVFSSAALVDFVGGVWDATDPAERGGSLGELLRSAYVASDDASRLSAMRNIWDGGAYSRQIITARSAAGIGVSQNVSSDDAERLIASMMSAGLDIQALRWANTVSRGSLGWAMLAVGAPRGVSGIDAATVESVAGGDENRRIKFLLAGLAGLGRLSPDQASTLARTYEVPLGSADNWTRAIDRAASANEPGTVALLAVAGMQTREWRYVPPAYLFHIVAALKRVGLEPEARMIAVEALTRA